MSAGGLQGENHRSRRTVTYEKCIHGHQKLSPERTDLQSVSEVPTSCGNEGRRCLARNEERRTESANYRCVCKRSACGRRCGTLDNREITDDEEGLEG